MITIKPKLSEESFEVGEYYAYPKFRNCEDNLRFYYEPDNAQQNAFIEMVKDKSMICDIEIEIERDMILNISAFVNFVKISWEVDNCAYVELEVIIPPQHA